MISLVPLALVTLSVVPVADTPGLRLPAGFRMSLYADGTLAPDIQAMTLDRHGRVVVTGPGYVRTLLRGPDPTRAARATDYANPSSGGQGMATVGDDLLITADGWLLRYRDPDGDGRAEDKPDRIVRLKTSEHGGHAIRKGPDGWFYVVAGNDAGVTAREVRPSRTLVGDPEAGLILRVSPDLKSIEVVAHGFRNPYDLDFGPLGDLFAYDSDCERDELLPWATPCRLFRVVEGGHHGWRLTGSLRSLARRPDLFDAVAPAVDLGRGSPTGVVVYRHRAFPGRYRGGVFLADWTFGRIWFVPGPTAAEPSPRPEVFAEAIGEDGFAPTDLAVTPDGALVVSIGGRKTRGAVYRIEPAGAGPGPVVAANDLDRVLRVDQPLDDWSRETWVPLARSVGRDAIEAAMADPDRTEAEAIRAAEVAVEVFDGPSVASVEVAWAEAGARPRLRARLAWALGRRSSPIERPARLADRSGDPDVAAALVGLDAATRLDPPGSSLPGAVAIRSDRVIPALVGAVRSISAECWPDPADLGPRADLNVALARRRVSGSDDSIRWTIAAGLRVLSGRAEARDRLDAVRLIGVALGDWDVNRAEADVFVPYTLARRAPDPAAILERVRPLVGSADARLDEEATRLVAMLGDPDPATRRALVARWTAASDPRDDLRNLIAFARLTYPIPAEDWGRVASTLVGLDRKWRGRPGRLKQTWNVRVGELFRSLSRDQFELVDALVALPEFAREEQAEWAAMVDPKSRVRVGIAFFEAARAGRVRADGYVLTILDALPRDLIRAEIRRNERFGISPSAATRYLVEGPEPEDRDWFLSRLAAADAAEVATIGDGLDRLAPGGDLAPALDRLARLVDEPAAGPARVGLARWIARNSDLDPADLGPEPAGRAGIVDHYRGLFDVALLARPGLAGRVSPPARAGPGAFDPSKPTIPWGDGSADRGRASFVRLKCASCHEGGGAGPSLVGAARRMSRDDLFAAIVQPSRDVAPAYRSVIVALTDGTTRTGLIVFQSGDGLMIQPASGSVERIPAAAIESRKESPTSLMPEGLLSGLSDADAADLYVYLRSL